MRIHSIVRASFALAALTGVIACSQDGSSRLDLMGPGPGGSAEILASSNLVTLPFDEDNFASPQANPYFPLVQGMVYTYRGTSKKDEAEINTVEVTSLQKTILGVAVTVVHDVVRLEDGSVKEDTYDWYAADQDGNVWYFGEDTKEYDHGTFITDEGSWEAGKDGAKPGIIMLANPRIGDQYKQEDAAGVVEDMAKVVSLTETVTVPEGTFHNCLKTTEWTPIEPGNRSHKYYAPAGVGLVLELASRQGGERVELIDR